MLQRPPSVGLWEEVAAVVERAAREDGERAVREWWPYVVEHLGRWDRGVRRRAPEGWVAAAREGVRGLPWEVVTALEVRPEEAGFWAKLRDEGRLSGVTELALSQEVVRVDVVRGWLALVGQLEDLALIGPWSDEAVLGEVLELDAMARLEGLATFRQALSAGTLRLLADASLPALKSLRLASARVDDEGAAILARARWIGQLRHLLLPGNRISDAGGVALVEAVGASEVFGLQLDHNALGDATAEALASSPRLGAIEVLALSHNRITARGAQALADAPAIAGVTSLSMHNNALGPGGLLALVNSPHLRDEVKAELRRVMRVNASPYRVKSVARMGEVPEKQGRELRRLVPRGQVWAEARALRDQEEVHAKPALGTIKLSPDLE